MTLCENCSSVAIHHRDEAPSLCESCNSAYTAGEAAGLKALRQSMENKGVYLQLYNGRTSPDEQLDDWGTTGPTFGPYRAVQITYRDHIKMLHGMGFDDLGYVEDTVYYDGVYYGDFVIQDAPHADATEKYDEGKARKQ